MMKKNLACLLFILASFILSNKALGQNYTVTVTITGLHSNAGKVVLTLYNAEDGYPKEPKKAFRQISGTISNNTSNIILNNIPKGVYAVACYHDENGNGKLDSNFLGIPVEGVGASNNAKGFMGPPKFNDAKFNVERDMAVSLKISYL
jgi:uncharacterized protein (DUF2141 family)